MEKRSYVHGTGRRKTSVAQVRLMSGEGAIVVNGMPYEDFFPRIDHRQAIRLPFVAAGVVGQYSAVIKVEGGGITGQSGAIAHGIARALV
ncbi:MAG: 30S ribosomal protein S9, partial [Chloroflexota bacterium]